MSRARALPLLLLVALALLGAGWWLGQRQSSGGVAPAATRGSGDSAPGAAAAGQVAQQATTGQETSSSATLIPDPVAAAPAAAVSSLPLPARGLPLAQTYEELRERARNGDARAACRLARDLQRCRWMPQGVNREGRGGGRGGRGGWMRDRVPAGMEERIAGIEDDERREQMIQQMAEFESRVQETEALCEGVTTAQIDEAFAFQMQAAHALPEARVDAALNPALDRMFPGSELERWQQYRQVAQPWLEQAAAQGDLAAIIALARVHGDARRPGPPTPPYRDLDDERFVAYATLMERYGVQIPAMTQPVEEARARLSPEAARRAEARADSLHRPGLSYSREQQEAALRNSLRIRDEDAGCE